MQKKAPAIGIVRISSKRQEGNTSQETQERAIKSYCEANSLNLARLELITESAKDSERYFKMLWIS